MVKYNEINVFDITIHFINICKYCKILVQNAKHSNTHINANTVI